jgi:ABC-type phosphate transport system substrate-binding protein
MRKLVIHSLLAALGVTGLAALAKAEVAVIVNPKSAVSALSADQVAAIFSGASTKLPDGSSAVLSDQPESSPLRETFYSDLVGKNPSQAKAIWARLMFTGAGVPPKELKSSADVIAFVSSTPNAVGYVSKSEVDGSVKVVFSK